MCNAWNHPPGCTCGWGGDGHLGGGGQGATTRRTSTLPGAGTRSIWQYRDDFSFQTSCPYCRASVYFVRHNGGSVWFNDLGWPWPKHACFYDDPNDAQFLRHLTEKVNICPNPLLGLTVETIVLNPGASGRVVVLCPDGTVINKEFDTNQDLTQCVGCLVVVERTANDGVKLHWIAHSVPTRSEDDKPVVPLWVAKHIENLGNSDVRVRNAAEIILGRMAPEDLDGIYGLLQAKQHKSYLIRVTVEEILKRLAHRAAPTLAKMYGRMPFFRKDVELLLRASGPFGKAQLWKAKAALRRLNAEEALRRKDLLTALREKKPDVKPENLVVAKSKQRRQRPTKTVVKAKQNALVVGDVGTITTQQSLIKCKICGVSVKQTRLVKHMRKVHQTGGTP